MPPRTSGLKSPSMGAQRASSLSVLDFPTPTGLSNLRHKTLPMGARAGSVVKNSVVQCSCRGPRFDAQYPQGYSQL